MTTEQYKIKNRILELFKIIEDSNIEIADIQKKCKHESTTKGIYSYRIGAYLECEICNICNKPIIDLSLETYSNNITTNNEENE
jgi:hypothetical protein